MPTYEYECRGCHHEFDARQPITQDPLLECPKCKKNLLTRKIGRGSLVQFKGSGFYETDYKSKPRAKP